MKEIALAALVAASIFAVSPASSQTAAQQAKESTGEANSQKQLGGLKRDTRIDRKIARHKHSRMHHHQHG